MSQELWDILDENGNPTGRTVARGDILRAGETHLVVHIWLVDESGRYLIQKRADHVDWMPGVWATTGGSVIAGEDGGAAAHREAEEELGVSIPHLQHAFRFHHPSRDGYEDVWMARVSSDIVQAFLLENTVAAVKWVTEEELVQMIQLGEFFDYSRDYFERLFAAAEQYERVV